MTKKVRPKTNARKPAVGDATPRAEPAKSGMIRARIAPDLKAEAENILDQIGLTSSDAIRMLYKQVTLCKGLPFEARIPNATTRKALRDAEAGNNLTEYADADDLFNKLGVKRGQS